MVRYARFTGSSPRTEASVSREPHRRNGADYTQEIARELPEFHGFGMIVGPDERSI